MITLSVSVLCALVAAGEIATLVRLRLLMSRFEKRQMISAPSMLRDMPSVSVCIPARNERHAMTRCLEAVLSSTYPKLEIIVLDDESVDNTSNLIRAFARDGVRFIAGSTPPSGWLGKNFALQTLATQASGTYVLFLDVDTIISPYSISQMVAYAEAGQSSMISVLPQRSDLWRASVLLAPLRYYWHIVFHRMSRPVVTSNAWMIRRKKLLADFEGFNTIQADVEPEVTIAAHYYRDSGYKFLTSTHLLGVTYEKKMSSQIETAIRLRYPSLGHSAMRAIGATFLKVVAAVSPLLALLYMPSGVLPAIALYVLGCTSYLMYLQFVWKKGALLGMWLWPVVLLGDAWLTFASMIRYETHTVTWKGRSITSLDR